MGGGAEIVGLARFLVDARLGARAGLARHPLAGRSFGLSMSRHFPNST